MSLLNSLKQTGKGIGQELSGAWESLSEGWHELHRRSSSALTHSALPDDAGHRGSSTMATFPGWGLLAGEVEETSTEILVRFELPGIDKDDCRITFEGNMLHLSGEKHFERETQDSTYHVMERTYGAFQRSISLPRNVNIDMAEARYKNGVLTVRLPKGASGKAKSIPVS